MSSSACNLNVTSPIPRSSASFGCWPRPVERGVTSVCRISTIGIVEDRRAITKLTPLLERHYQRHADWSFGNRSGVLLKATTDVDCHHVVEGLGARSAQFRRREIQTNCGTLRGQRQALASGFPGKARWTAAFGQFARRLPSRSSLMTTPSALHSCSMVPPSCPETLRSTSRLP